MFCIFQQKIMVFSLSFGLLKYWYKTFLLKKKIFQEVHVIVSQMLTFVWNPEELLFLPPVIYLCLSMMTLKIRNVMQNHYYIKIQGKLCHKSNLTKFSDILKLKGHWVVTLNIQLKSWITWMMIPIRSALQCFISLLVQNVMMISQKSWKRTTASPITESVKNDGSKKVMAKNCYIMKPLIVVLIFNFNDKCDTNLVIWRYFKLLEKEDV